MAEERKPLGQLVADLQKEFGEHHYGRVDLHIPDNVKQGTIKRAALADTKKLGNFPVSQKADMDGIKFFLDTPTNGNGADAWVLFRASGTEPLLRIYTEAASPGLVSEILASAEAFVKASS
jgi:phosphomannomutase